MTPEVLRELIAAGETLDVDLKGEEGAHGMSGAPEITARGVGDAALTQQEHEMTTTGDRRASGVSREGIFGDGRGAEPATPGSYGMAPSGFRLPEGTRLGPVRLQVADLERSLAFYQEVLGMRLLAREPTRARLGSQAAEGSSATGAPDGAAATSPVLLELEERRGARPAPRGGRTGLFHFAILLPDRPSLGCFATHARRLGLGVGAADHLVSESLYLHDPDRLGIEVYADRPRSAWRRIGRELVMATDPLDWPGLVEAAGEAPWAGLPPGTVIGHLHLHVGDLAAASAFYSEALGFDRTVWHYPGALFLAAGGYHHHLGTNVWAGTDATPPAEDEAQLLEWTIELPEEGALAAASESLERAGFEVELLRAAGRDEEVVALDPWGTPVRLQGPAAAAHSSP
jgi:catechol 2,3-dioxygenase